MSMVLRILEPALADILRAAGLVSCEDYLRSSRGEVIHESNTTCTRRFDLPSPGGTIACYLKVYQYRDKPLTLRLGRSKPLREARNYLTLRRKCRIDVPDVIAIGARRRLGLLEDGFILTREVPAACPLDVYVDRRWPSNKENVTVHSRRRLLETVADLVARMHAAHFFHIDLQWRNLIVSDDERDQPLVFVLDCVRGGRRIHPLMRAHGRLRDLSSLYKDARVRLSHTEQMRWLRRYLGTRKLSEVYRAMIRTIVQDRELKDSEAPA